MFSKILIKLIDQAIVPAILLLTVRVGSMIGVAHYFKIPFEIGQTGFVFNTPQDYVFVNSYSILVMLIVLSVGILYILSKSFLVHDTHISPGLTAKLFSLRLTTFIQTSFDLYSQGTVWLSYSYLLFFVSVAMAMFGLLYAWVAITALVLTVVATVLFIFDIEQEFSFHTKGPFSDDPDGDPIVEEYVLKFKEGFSR